MNNFVPSFTPEMTPERSEWLKNLKVGDSAFYYKNRRSKSPNLEKPDPIRVQVIKTGNLIYLKEQGRNHEICINVKSGCNQLSFIAPTQYVLAEIETLREQPMSPPELTSERIVWLQNLKKGDEVAFHVMGISEPGKFKPRPAKVSSINPKTGYLHIGLCRVRLADGCATDSFISPASDIPLYEEEELEEVRLDVDGKLLWVGSRMINLNHVVHANFEHVVDGETMGVIFYFKVPLFDANEFGAMPEEPNLDDPRDWFMYFHSETARAIRKAFGYKISKQARTWLTGCGESVSEY